jgi:hypothetical protein
VTSPLWRVAGGVALRFWADEAIVFVDATQETHLVGPPAAALLRRLDTGAASEDALGDGESLAAAPLAEILQTLASGGIVEEEAA